MNRAPPTLLPSTRSGRGGQRWSKGLPRDPTSIEETRQFEVPVSGGTGVVVQLGYLVLDPLLHRAEVVSCAPTSGLRHEADVWDHGSSLYKHT